MLCSECSSSHFTLVSLSKEHLHLLNKTKSIHLLSVLNLSLFESQVQIQKLFGKGKAYTLHVASPSQGYELRQTTTLAHVHSPRSNWLSPISPCYLALGEGRSTWSKPCNGRTCKLDAEIIQTAGSEPRSLCSEAMMRTKTWQSHTPKNRGTFRLWCIIFTLKNKNKAKRAQLRHFTKSLSCLTNSSHRSPQKWT